MERGSIALGMVERRFRICRDRTVSWRLYWVGMLGEGLPGGGVHPVASAPARSRPHPTAVLQLLSGLGWPWWWWDWERC